jgi:hypothetical protein
MTNNETEQVAISDKSQSFAILEDLYQIRTTILNLEESAFEGDLLLSEYESDAKLEVIKLSMTEEFKKELSNEEKRKLKVSELLSANERAKEVRDVVRNTRREIERQKLKADYLQRKLSIYKAFAGGSQ